jgi:hypothetical protein
VLDNDLREGFLQNDFGLTVATTKMFLYGYETWSLTLRKEHRLRLFENRVLRRIFGSGREMK